MAENAKGRDARDIYWPGAGETLPPGVLEPPRCGDLAPGQKDLLLLLIPGNGGARTPVKDGIQGAGVPIHIGTCRAAGGG